MRKDYSESRMEALAVAEREVGLVRDEDTAAWRHIALGNLAVASQYFFNPLRRWGEQPFWRRFHRTFRRRRSRLFRQLFALNFYRSSAKADIVLFKSNLRGFYCRQGVTLRLPIGEASRSRVSREIDLRRRLAIPPEVLVPELVAAEAAEAAGCVAEKLVLDAEPLDLDVDADFAARSLFAFYRANGIEAVPLGDVIALEAELDRLQTHAARFGFEIPDAVDAALRRTSGDPNIATMPVLHGLCHGDLTPTNLKRLANRLVLFDLEHAGAALLFSDAARLVRESPRFFEAFSRQSLDWSQEQDIAMLAPDVQMLLGALVAANRRLERFSEEEKGDGARIAAYRRKAESYLGLMSSLLKGGKAA